MFKQAFWYVKVCDLSLQIIHLVVDIWVYKEESQVLL